MQECIDINGAVSLVSIIKEFAEASVSDHSENLSSSSVEDRGASKPALAAVFTGSLCAPQSAPGPNEGFPSVGPSVHLAARGV